MPHDLLVIYFTIAGVIIFMCLPFLLGTATREEYTILIVIAVLWPLFIVVYPIYHFTYWVRERSKYGK